MTLPGYAYFKGDIVPYSEARVGVLTHAMNYGTAVFGGLRGYWNEDEEQLFVFRPYDHYRRLLNSAKMMAMELDHTPESLTEATIRLLQTEGHRRDVYIRPLAYDADEIIGVKLHGLTSEVSIVSLPFDKYVANDTNAHVTFSSWRRIDDNAIPARGKISGAYVNSAFIKTDAIRAGFDEALVLTQEGHISEGSAMNIFMIRDGVAYTPPMNENILEGITRRTVIKLLKDDLDVDVVERRIDRTEIYICDEFFMTGTAAQVTAVTRVDHRSIGTGVMGEITSALRDRMNDVVHGRVGKYRDWNVPVYVKEAHPTAQSVNQAAS